jgi:hypothetical protein
MVQVYWLLANGVVVEEFTPVSTLAQFEKMKASEPEKLISKVGQNQKSWDNWILSGRV